MSEMGVAARLARREVVRRPWRSLVVVLLVLVPVVALTGFAVMVRTIDRSNAESFAANWGEGDVLLEDLDAPAAGGAGEQMGDGFEGDARDIFLVDGSRHLEFARDDVRLRTAEGERAWAEVTDLPVDDPMVADAYEVVDGRLPTAADEVALTEPLADDVDVEVGDELVLTRPAERTVTVVGTTRRAARLSARMMLVAPSEDHATLTSLLGLAPPDDEGQVSVGASPASVPWLLVDLPPGAEEDPAVAEGLRSASASRFVEPWSDNRSPQVAIVWSWVGGTVAFVIVGVVIAAAFAVTARRQLRLLGQLMGNGARESVLRATLFLQGTVVGVIGGVVGIAVALAALAAGEPLVEHLVDRRLDGYRVAFWDLVPILVLATAAATGAALVPARHAARTSVLEALAGRRPVGPYPTRLVVRGALAALGGLVLLAVATTGAAGAADDGGGGTELFVLTGVVGAMAVILGTCAMAPALVARLEPAAGWLRGPSRLAARSVARQRARTGAIVAAIAVVAAGAVSASTVWAIADGEEQTQYWSMPSNTVLVQQSRHAPPADGRDGKWVSRDDAPSAALIDEIQAVTDGEVIEVPYARVPAAPAGAAEAWGPSLPTAGPSLWVIDASSAATLGLRMDVREALDRTGVVVVGWRTDGRELDGIEDGPVALADEQGRTWATVEGSMAPPSWLPPAALVTEERAEELGLEISAGPVLVRGTADLSEDQRDALRDVRDDAWETLNGTQLGYVEEGAAYTDVWVWFDESPRRPSRVLITAAIVGVATLLSLGVVALGLALSAAETKDERDVLAVVGAPPRTVRGVAGWKAAVLASIGTAVGVPLGFVPTWVVAQAADVRIGSVLGVFPWVQAGLLVVVVPVVAALATVLASGVTLRVRPVQASSMAFD